MKRLLVAALILAAALLGHSAPAHAQVQTVSIPGYTGQSSFRLWFDVTAANPLTITTVTAGTLGPDTFSIYGRPGSHVGLESSLVGWTLLSTVTTTSDGPNSLVLPVNVPLTAGETYALTIVSDVGGRVHVVTGSSVGAVGASDANLSVLDGVTAAGPGPAPRRLSGSVTYTLAPTPVPTMPGWAMILFGTLLAGGAALYIQRRQLAA